MPDKTRPPRNHPKDDRPTLGALVIMGAIDDFAKARGIVGARLAYQKNDAGEHVVALIFPSQPPRPRPPSSTWASRVKR